jgi:hypothetical protein
MVPRQPHSKVERKMTSTNPQQAGITAARPRLRNEDIPFRERATCTIKQACAGTGLGRTLIYELIDENLIQSTLVKRRRLINVPSLLKAVGVKPDAEGRANENRKAG